MLLGFLNCAMTTLAILFTFCYFGMWNELYVERNEKLPLQLQKYLILMIGNMRKLLHYHGYILTLDLNRFLRVSEYLNCITYKDTNHNRKTDIFFAHSYTHFRTQITI